MLGLEFIAQTKILKVTDLTKEYNAFRAAI
jgi:hypothetical protein